MSTSTLKAQLQTVAQFVSDVHLQPSNPKTEQVFISFLRQQALQSPRLYLLGDLFDAWAGDDDMETPWTRHIVEELRAVSRAGVEIGWISGNRDFLIGEKFAQTAGVTLLAEQHVTMLAGKRIVLTHGDALCTDDHAYMEFRAKVRLPEAQRQFLAMPLVQRKVIIEGMRHDSHTAQQSKTMTEMDVNAEAVAALFEQTDAEVMIHGHTHRPMRYDTDGSKHVRYVLTDWNCEVKPERGGWLTLYSDGSIRRFDIKGRMVTHLPEQKIPGVS